MSITPEYKEQLRQMHQSASFGKRAKMPKHLESFVEEINPSSILDFGCGKGNLVALMREKYPTKTVLGYDPGNTEFDKSLDDVRVDLLVSSDVLEHVEPHLIDETLDYLSKKSKFIYHLISLAPAKRKLPDGRNAHLIQESPEWWRTKFLNLGYKIIKEDYTEGYKRDILVKRYFIMAEK